MGSHHAASKDVRRPFEACLPVRGTRTGKTFEAAVSTPNLFPPDAPEGPTEGDEYPDSEGELEDLEDTEGDLELTETIDTLTYAFAVPRGPRDPDRVPMSRSFGRLVREKREARGWGRVELSHHANVYRDFVKVIETRGVKTAARADVESLMRVLGIKELPTPDATPKLEMWWEAPLKQTVPLSKRYTLLLRKHRQALKLTLNDVGDLIGEPASSCQLLEYDNRNGCNTQTLARVATAVQVIKGCPLGRRLLTLGFKWIGTPVNEKYLTRAIRGGRHIDWGKVPLGKKSDCEIAEDLGILVSTVQRARYNRKIPAFKGEKRAHRTEPPAYTLAQLREELGDPPVIDNHVNWLKVPLGCTTDKTLSRWLGVQRERVSNIRRRYGIPAYARVRWDLLPLGEIPDTVIADWVSVSVSCVATLRKSRSISAAPRNTRRDQAGVYSRDPDPKYLAPRELRFPVGAPNPWPRKPSQRRPLLSKVMDPPAQKGTNLWDYVEEVVAFLEGSSESRPEKLVYYLGFRKAKQRLHNARELLSDLEWRELPDGRWVPPHTVVAIQEPEEAPELLTLVQKGLWSVAELAKKIGSSNPKTRKRLEELVSNNLIQRVGHGPAVRYFANPN